MVTRIVTIDGKRAILIDEEQARQLGLEEGTEVRLEVEERRLIVSAERDGVGEGEIERHMGRVEREFGEALRKLGE